MKITIMEFPKANYNLTYLVMMLGNSDMMDISIASVSAAAAVVL